jgi:hypothetical protein
LKNIHGRNVSKPALVLLAYYTSLWIFWDDFWRFCFAGYLSLIKKLVKLLRHLGMRQVNEVTGCDYNGYVINSY